MSEEYWTAGPPMRWPASRARGSPSGNQADAIGDEATPRCRGSIPEKLLELKPRQETRFSIWRSLARFRFHAERLTPNGGLSTGCSGRLSIPNSGLGERN